MGRRGRSPGPGLGTCAVEQVSVTSGVFHAIRLAKQSAQSPVKQEELEQGADCTPPPLPSHTRSCGRAVRGRVIVSQVTRGTRACVLIQARVGGKINLIQTWRWLWIQCGHNPSRTECRVRQDDELDWVKYLRRGRGRGTRSLDSLKKKKKRF